MLLERRRYFRERDPQEQMQSVQEAGMRPGWFEASLPGENNGEGGSVGWHQGMGGLEHMPACVPWPPCLGSRSRDQSRTGA